MQPSSSTRLPPPRSDHLLRERVPNTGIGPARKRPLAVCRALTLFEVMFAMGILTIVSLGVLQGMLQSRRLTEGSVRQASVASLVQGYLEQLKSIKYGDLPSSPATTPAGADLTAWGNAGNVVTVIDSTQSVVPAKYTICLAVGTPPSAMPNCPLATGITTLPTDASMRTETVDIDNINSTDENTTLNMWVWINDMTDPTNRPNVVNCKSIVIIYQWTLKDGGRVRYTAEMIRAIRSSVPTD